MLSGQLGERRYDVVRPQHLVYVFFPTQPRYCPSSSHSPSQRQHKNPHCSLLIFTLKSFPDGGRREVSPTPKKSDQLARQGDDQPNNVLHRLQKWCWKANRSCPRRLLRMGLLRPATNDRRRDGETELGERSGSPCGEKHSIELVGGLFWKPVGPESKYVL